MSTLKPENIITIRNVFKIPRMYVEPCIDPKTNRLPSHVRKVDSNGDQILSDSDKASGEFLIGENEVIEIYDGKTFDLDDPYDLAWWNAIKHSKRIVQERHTRNAKGELVVDGNALRYGSAEFYIERVGKEAELRVSKRKLIHQAEDYIFNDSKHGIYQKARLLGNPMDFAPLAEVEEYLVSLASKNPEKLITLYTGEDTHLRILLMDAQDKGVIRYAEKLYQYGQIVLGVSQETCITWIKNPANKRLVERLKQDTYPELYETIEEPAEFFDEVPTQEPEASKVEVDFSTPVAEVAAKKATSPAKSNRASK